MTPLTEGTCTTGQWTNWLNTDGPGSWNGQNRNGYGDTEHLGYHSNFQCDTVQAVEAIDTSTGQKQTTKSGFIEES